MWNLLVGSPQSPTETRASMVAVRQRRPSIMVALVLALLHPGIATARQLGAAGSMATRSTAVDGRRLAPCRGTRPPRRYAHVVWIWFENHSANQVIGSSEAPYINAIARTCGQATRYSAISHPSLPNYIAATSGGTQGITDDGRAEAERHERGQHLPGGPLVEGLRGVDAEAVHEEERRPLRRPSRPLGLLPAAARGAVPAGRAARDDAGRARSPPTCAAAGCRGSASSRPTSATTCTTAAWPPATPG